jgi:DmsE family decaheme c-type cytochrome
MISRGICHLVWASRRTTLAWVAVGAVAIGGAAWATAQTSLAAQAVGAAQDSQPSPSQFPPGVALPESQWGANIGVAKCTSCHEAQGKGYREGPHSTAWDPRTPAASQGCETCHGPGQAHEADVGAKGRMRSFLKMTPRDVNRFCLTCHNREEHAQWNAGMHDARNLSCLNCHSNHSSKSAVKLLKRETVTATCAQCHREKAAKLLGSAHMPVREGKMECTTCHNQHGSTNVRMLRTGNTINELCSSCHAEKRGPFLWEHPPVRENCATCHDPHGSTNDRLLVAKVPYLCQRCHIATQHPAAIYDTRSTSVRFIGRGCVNCHAQIHGSNHPSGYRFHR